MMKYLKDLIENGDLDFAEAVKQTASHFGVHENIIWEEVAQSFIN